MTIQKDNQGISECAHIFKNPFTILQALPSSGGQSANLPIPYWTHWTLLNDPKYYPAIPAVDALEGPRDLLQGLIRHQVAQTQQPS